MKDNLQRILFSVMFIGILAFAWTGLVFGENESSAILKDESFESKTALSQLEKTTSGRQITPEKVSGSKTISKKETVTLPTMVVEGQKKSKTADQPSESAVGTIENINKSTIDIQGGAEQISPYKAISTLPGVDVRTQDAFGLNTSHRIRGKGFSTDGESIEGLPIKQRGPGVGLSTIIDLENIDSISVSKGPISADKGFGSGNANGLVDLHAKQPSDEFHATAKQIFGTDDFSRSYARVDTGNLGEVAKGFISGSTTRADKWKGKGNSPDGRKNFALGISGISGHPIEWELNSFYNNDNAYGYRGMTYDKTTDLSRNYEYDYNTALTGTSTTDAYYYDYNRQHFTTHALFGKIIISLPFVSQSSLTLKPYYLNEEGYTYSGGILGTSGNVAEGIIDHYIYGGVLEYKQEISNGQIKAGYWYGESLPPGPNVAQKNYTVEAATGRLIFNSWSTLIDASTAKYNSPYATMDKTFGPITMNAGVRYHMVIESDYDSYQTTGIGDVSFSDALDQATTKKYHLDGSKYHVFLPNIGAKYQVFDNLSFDLNYGRNYDNPGGLPNQFDMLYKKGLTEDQIQDLYSNKRKPELSNNLDLGINTVFENCFIESTLYYSRMKNVGGNFYDPVLDMSYQQTNAEAKSYGLETAAGYAFKPGLDANISLTYNKYEFTDNLVAVGGSIIESKGNQTPDAPHFIGNLTVNWQIGDLTVTPTARYHGKRYADVENKYSLDPYFLVDLDLSWKIKSSDNQNLTMKFSATNVLDKQYIASTSAANNATGNTTQTYIAGAPRTFFVGIQLDI